MIDARRHGLVRRARTGIVPEASGLRASEGRSLPRSAARRASRHTAPVIAIVGGLGAALCWAVAVLATARASREIGAWSTLAGVMTVGLVVTVPLIALGGGTAQIGTTELAIMAVIGLANVGGLLLAYTALRGGHVSVVAPILSTEGAIGALIAVVAGEQLAPGSGPILAAIVVGVVLASREREGGAMVGSLPKDSTIRTAALALGAATAFGANIYFVGVLGGALPAIWTALPARLLGTLAVAIPLVIFGRFRMTRRALPFVVIVGLAEVAGVVSLAIGAQESIAVASVMASQFAAIAVIAAVAFLGERVTRSQAFGIALIALGVAALTVLSA